MNAQQKQSDKGHSSSALASGFAQAHAPKCNKGYCQNPAHYKITGGRSFVAYRCPRCAPSFINNPGKAFQVQVLA